MLTLIITVYEHIKHNDNCILTKKIKKLTSSKGQFLGVFMVVKGNFYIDISEILKYLVKNFYWTVL